MCMHLYVSTGNKGGETKSFTALSFTDFLIRRGQKAILSDSEQDSIQATSTAIALNSGLHKFDLESPVYPALAAWKLGKSSTGWSDCMDDLANIGFDSDVSIVADTGASQMQAMIDNIEVLGAAVEAGMQASIIFLAGRTEDSTVAALSLFKAIEELAPNQRPRIWVLLVDQDGAPEEAFDLAHPYKVRGETVAQSILQRAATKAPELIRWRHVGRWPDIAFNCTMIARRMPSEALKDKNLGFGTRTKLRGEMLAIDRLFADIVTSKKERPIKEGTSHDSV